MMPQTTMALTAIHLERIEKDGTKSYFVSWHNGSISGSNSWTSESYLQAHPMLKVFQDKQAKKGDSKAHLSRVLFKCKDNLLKQLTDEECLLFTESTSFGLNPETKSELVAALPNSLIALPDDQMLAVVKGLRVLCKNGFTENGCYQITSGDRKSEFEAEKDLQFVHLVIDFETYFGLIEPFEEVATEYISKRMSCHWNHMKNEVDRSTKHTQAISQYFKKPQINLPSLSSFDLSFEKPQISWEGDLSIDAHVTQVVKDLCSIADEICKTISDIPVGYTVTVNFKINLICLELPAPVYLLLLQPQHRQLFISQFSIHCSQISKFGFLKPYSKAQREYSSGFSKASDALGKFSNMLLLEKQKQLSALKTNLHFKSEKDNLSLAIRRGFVCSYSRLENEPNQTWHLKMVEDTEYFHIVNQEGRCLDGEKTLISLKVVDPKSEHQHWKFNSVNDGLFQIICRSNSQAISINEKRIQPGGRLCLETPTSVSKHLWSFGKSHTFKKFWVEMLTVAKDNENIKKKLDLKNVVHYWGNLEVHFFLTKRNILKKEQAKTLFDNQVVGKDLGIYVTDASELDKKKLLKWGVNPIDFISKLKDHFASPRSELLTPKSPKTPRSVGSSPLRSPRFGKKTSPSRGARSQPHTPVSNPGGRKKRKNRRRNSKSGNNTPKSLRSPKGMSSPKGKGSKGRRSKMKSPQQGSWRRTETNV